MSVLVASWQVIVIVLPVTEHLTGAYPLSLLLECVSSAFNASNVPSVIPECSSILTLTVPSTKAVIPEYKFSALGLSTNECTSLCVSTFSGSGCGISNEPDALDIEPENTTFCELFIVMAVVPVVSNTRASGLDEWS